MENTRKRTIDIEKLSDEQLEAIQTKLIEKINPIVAQAIKDADRFLNPYGLSAKMMFEITEKQ